MEQEFKICSKCGENLPLYNFSFRTDSNKYRDQCKKCHKGYKTNLISRKLETESLLTQGLKKCGRCGEVKPITEYNTDKYTITKLTSFCKDCIKIKGFIYRNTEDAQRVLLKSRYNISDENITQYFNTKNCEICGKELSKKTKHLDHDHSTGKYRGALCHTCNVGLGHFLDNPELLRRAADYIDNNLKPVLW